MFNPAAGARRRRRLERALALLPGATVMETTHPGHAEHIARDAARDGATLVVAAGGDGTISEVASGLMGGEAALGILPLGTANVLALELGVPLRPEYAAMVLRHGRALSLWPGLGRFPDGRVRIFVQMMGVGFDASVVHGLDLGLKRAIGRGAYVWQAMVGLPRYRFPTLSVAMDGAPARLASSVVVTKGRLYAGRHLLAPGATPLAPGFHVALMPGAWGRAALAGALLPLDLLPRLPGIAIHRASRVTLDGAGAPAQADGDPAGTAPLVVEDAPAPIRVMVP
ncbi:diacylglycerol/lipid kinase family protein [Roseomonas sp. CCTCC AB2023176]|uniref:diacylglycerol/lipid kinase family protein n=1 Tax=Roseomonas sp. CCTCC AB2023176 TaxID=3342640 RepID=UPI0035D9C33D